MDHSCDEPRSRQKRTALLPLTHFSRNKLCLRKRALLWSAFIPLIVLSGLLGNWIFLAQNAYAAPQALSSKPGHLTLQQAQQEGQPNKQNQGTFKRPTTHPVLQNAEANANKQKQNQSLPSAEPAKMKDQTFTLDGSFVLHRPKMASSTKAAKVTGTAIPAGSTSFQIKGSDGRLEVDLARDSLDFSQAKLADGSTPIGQLLLQLHQLSGHYIGTSSILGTYQIQIVDSQGNVVQGVKLLQPLTIRYHYQDWEMQDLNLDPNAIFLSWPTLLSAAQAAKQPATGLALPMTNDATAQTLTAQSLVIGGELTASGNPEIEAPAHPDIFATNGNSGQYSYSYPISVSPGPAGFAPQLQLSYSSQGTNQRYSRRAPAGDEGDGWSLSLGSITAAQYPDTSTGGARTWYSINGVDGISDKLVPDPANQTTFYSTQHISHLRIQWTGSCWHVWDRDGSYYQLGCTSDSLQTSSSGTYEWDVNQILAPYNTSSQVKAMLISYLQDSPSSGVIRDSGIKQIQYGFATGAPASSLSQVVGTVDFHYHAPTSNGSWATAYGNNYHCDSPPATTTLRCDDPVATTISGVSMPAPDVMSTLTLDSITNYIGSDTSGQKAYSYAFSYEDRPYSTGYFDPINFIQQAGAGEHLLKQITPTVYAAGTAHAQPPVLFDYSGLLTDSYRDPGYQVPNGNDFSGQTFWSYLTFYEDLQTGIGATIGYTTAYANMEGTPDHVVNGVVTDDRFNPLYCSLYSGECTGSSYGHPEDYSWSLQVVTQVAALSTDSSGNTAVSTTQYRYDLTPMGSTRTPASCHPITGNGAPAEAADCVGDSWVPGYDGSTDHDGDWADYYHSEFRGFSTVYTTSPANNLMVDYYFGTDGWWTPTSNGTNYNTGQMFQQDIYQGPNEVQSAILKETLNYFTGVGNTPDEGNTYHNNSCNGNLSQVYTPCVAAALETLVYFYDGNAGTANEPNVPWLDTKYTFDDMNADGGYAYSGYHNLTQEVITGTNLLSSVYPLTKKWTYTTTNGQGTNGIFYYDVDKVTHSEIDDAKGHVWACQDTAYDEGATTGLSTPTAGWATTQTSYSTCGTASTALTSYTAYDQYGNAVATVDPLAVANPSLYSTHGCRASGVVNLSANWTAAHFTSCTTYDTANTASLPVTQTNALGQATSTSYDYTSGAQPSTITDANGQPTGYSYAYDSNGNETISLTAPGDTGYTSRQSESTSCVDWRTLVTQSTPYPLLTPCYEIDTNSSLYSSAITRTFYDAQGRAVETRTPGPTPGDDTVVETVYNDQNDSVWKSEPFQVASGSGWIDPTGAKDVNGTVPAGTMTFSDALGRTLATQDPNWNSSQEPGLACSTVLTGKYTTCTNYTYGQAVGDSDDYFSSATSIDANGHVSQSFTDASGFVVFTQQDSGIYGGTLTPIQQTQTRYNALSEPTAVIVTDEQPQTGETPSSVTTSAIYDDQGRLLTMTDPDQGKFTYTYDPDGQVLMVKQTSGSSNRVLGYNYDLLGRVGCKQTAAPTINWNGACSAGKPLLQNTYDTTFLGTQGASDFPVGQLTQSVATTYYPDNTSATVTQQYQTDKRGQTTNEQMQFGLPSSWNVTVGLPTYQLSMVYNDDGQVTTAGATAGSATYSFTQIYDATNGVVQGLSSGSNSTANLATVDYNEFAQLSGITYLNGSGTQVASTQYSYDGNLRPMNMATNWLPGSGNSGNIIDQSLSYDNEGNVTGLNTFLASVPGQSGSGGTEAQNFCYDEQNRLVWSGNGGTQPGAGNGTCGTGALSNSLSGANYTAPYTYTNLGQIWQGPVNGQGASEQYLYCNSAPHQLTGIYPTGTTCATKGSATALYSASYDAWGNETSRTYNGTTATLSYDALNRLVEYNAGNTVQEFYLYDANGNRVLKRSITGTGTNLTVYAYGLQELSYVGTGGNPSQTDYYSLVGHLIGSTDGTTTTYDLTDALGSVLMSLNSSGVQGEQVYGPYGNQRYIQGNVATDKGYTGQYHDAVSGLDYYMARYYDPVMGQFLSADHVQGNAQGVDPYAYVGGSPETYIDPTGYMPVTSDGRPANPQGWKQFLLQILKFVVEHAEEIPNWFAIASLIWTMLLAGVYDVNSALTIAKMLNDAMPPSGDVSGEISVIDGSKKPEMPTLGGRIKIGGGGGSGGDGTGGDTGSDNDIGNSNKIDSLKGAYVRKGNQENKPTNRKLPGNNGQGQRWTIVITPADALAAVAGSISPAAAIAAYQAAIEAAEEAAEAYQAAEAIAAAWAAIGVRFGDYFGNAGTVSVGSGLCACGEPGDDPGIEPGENPDDPDIPIE